MAYTYRFINKNIQPTSVSFSLILTDDNEKEIRIEKCFKVDYNLIDDEFLRLEAKKEIERITEEQNRVEIIEVSPDDAESN